MPLTDMNALAAAWLVAPLLLIGSSCGIGLLVSSLSNLRLGAATAPAGLLATIVVVNTLLWLRLPAALVIALIVVGAVIGLLIGLRRVKGSRESRADEHGIKGDNETGSEWNPVITGAIAATVVWVGGMLPIVLMGRLGVLGYILNNDAAIHVAVVEVMRDHGAAGLSDPSVSTDVAGGLYTTNYPTGGQVPALLAAMLTKSPGFHVWSPVLVTCMAMIALVSTHLHKRFGSPQGIALIGSILAGGGYLTYSYMLQGGMKEVLLALSIPTIAALAILAREANLAPRSLLPTALGIASLPSVMSLGGFVWLAPAALAFGAICITSPPTGLSRLKTLAIVLAVGLTACALAAPAIISSVAFTSENSAVISDQDQIGNLLGPVPWQESLGVWFSHDYRSGQPQFFPRINGALVVVLFALSLIGLGSSIRRRNWELPLALFAAASAALLLTVKYSIYFEAKAYVVLAPLMALAVGFGLTTVYSLPPLRRPAIALTGVIAVASLLSIAFTYPTVWYTPQQRFDELASIAGRLAGKGGVLVSDREDYARVILERNNTRQPWQSYPTAVLGLRNPGLIGDSTLTADVDDYLDGLLREVDWIVDRRRPAGSRPPGNFDLAWETGSYTVWRRVERAPRERLPIGDASTFWNDRFDCRADAASAFVKRAQNRRVRVAVSGERPVLLRNRDRRFYGSFGIGPNKELLQRLNTVAVIAAEPSLRAGVKYDVFLRGSFNRGFEHVINGKQGGAIQDDLGLWAGWQRLSSFTAQGDERDRSTMFGLEKGLWRPGSMRSDLVGYTAYVPSESRSKVIELDGDRLPQMCGKRLDWVELL